MSDITELAQRMKSSALKATQGEWWSDVVETDGEYGDGDDRESGYHSYAVYDAQGRSLLDMTNSTAATIQTEWDRDYHLAWDVVGEHNVKHIIASQPQNVLALIEELEAKDKQIAQDVQIKARLCRESNSLHDRLRDAEKRIAELEQFKVAFTEWLDKTEWVQTDKRFDVVKPWGKHRADVLKLYIEHLEARTVKLPSLKQSESGERYVWSDGVHNFKEDVIKVLCIAGVAVEGE